MWFAFGFRKLQLPVGVCLGQVVCMCARVHVCMHIFLYVYVKIVLKTDRQAVHNPEGKHSSSLLHTV